MDFSGVFAKLTSHKRLHDAEDKLNLKSACMLLNSGTAEFIFSDRLEADASLCQIGQSRTDYSCRSGLLCLTDEDISGEARALKAILAQERQLRDRNSQLMVPGKTFKRVLDILAKVQATQAAADARPAPAKPHASAHPRHTHVHPPPPPPPLSPILLKRNPPAPVTSPIVSRPLF